MSIVDEARAAELENNEIIAALGTTDEQQIRNRLDERKAAHRRLKAMVRSSRERDWEAVRAAVDVTEGVQI